MSYITVDLKVIEVQGPAMARALGVDENTVLAGLLRLWHRCWSLKTDTITTLEVRGFLSHPDACAAMEAFGFLAPTGDGKWRVKGADTYLRVREARAKGGAARAASAGRSAGQFTSTTPAQHQQDTSTAPALTPNTEHRTPNTFKDKDMSDTALPVEPLALEFQEPPSPSRPKSEQLLDELTDDEFQVFEHWRIHCDHRGARATKERKKLIAKWLKVYSVLELQHAIEGCGESPFHRGANDRHTRYDSLELILRDAKHIEDFKARRQGDAA